MKIHILQHVPFEGPGYIAEWAKSNACELSFTRFYEPDHQLPALTDLQSLVVLGGPMDVFSDHEYDWLHAEKAFIEDCIQAGKRVLGVCLGAQLAAHCLGAMVSTAPNKEIGWYPVETTADCERLPWFKQLFRNPQEVLHWHGDKLQVPYGGFELLRSDGNANQAFLFGDNVLGLQFHLEATVGSLFLMVENCRNELQPAPFIQSEDQLFSGIKNIPANQKIMAQILSEFLTSA